MKYVVVLCALLSILNMSVWARSLEKKEATERLGSLLSGVVDTAAHLVGDTVQTAGNLVGGLGGSLLGGGRHAAPANRGDSYTYTETVPGDGYTYSEAVPGDSYTYTYGE